MRSSTTKHETAKKSFAPHQASCALKSCLLVASFQTIPSGESYRRPPTRRGWHSLLRLDYSGMYDPKMLTPPCFFSVLCRLSPVCQGYFVRQATACTSLRLLRLALSPSRGPRMVRARTRKYRTEGPFDVGTDELLIWRSRRLGGLTGQNQDENVFLLLLLLLRPSHRCDCTAMYLSACKSQNSLKPRPPHKLRRAVLVYPKPPLSIYIYAQVPLAPSAVTGMTRMTVCWRPCTRTAG